MASVGSVGARGTDYGNTVFTDQQTKELSSQDFLELMVAQLSNQDFMNPVDDTQYLAQLAQFTSMQQMQEMANLSKQSYVLSLVGQNVTAARFKVNGEIESVTGIIDKISLLDNEYLIYIGDKSFSLDQIMSLNAPDTKEDTTPKDETDYGQPSFLISLIGKQVTAKKSGYEAVTGVVEKISMEDGMRFYIGDTWYSLEDIVSVEPAKPEEQLPEEGGDEAET